MHKTLAAAAVIAAGFFGLSALAADDPKAELIKLEADWSKASVAKDAATISKIIAPDWVGQGQDGKPSTRETVLADMKSGKDVATSMTNHDVHVRIIGDIAIVQGADDEKSTHEGKDSSGTYTWTDVFQKRSGHWVAIASQSTPVKKK
jgi:ketosteroid isomerase-like protein